MKQIYVGCLILISCAVLRGAELNDLILGSWKSNSELTIPELKKSKVLSEEQVNVLSSVVGKMEVHIHPGILLTKLNRMVDSGRWELLRKEEDKWIIKFTSERFETDESPVWFANGNMYVYSRQYDFIEVFSRIVTE
jgi:hypothetical protein